MNVALNRQVQVKMSFTIPWLGLVTKDGWNLFSQADKIPYIHVCLCKLKYTNPACRHSYFCKQKLIAPPLGSMSHLVHCKFWLDL